MTQLKATEIWRKLALDQQRMTDRKELSRLCQRAGMTYQPVVNYLQKHGYLVRVFRGIFYVRTPEERELRMAKTSLEEMVAMALSTKGVRRWYYGLESGLKFNNLTHEYFAVSYIITDSYRTTKIIDINGRKFRFYRWSRQRFRSGIVKVGDIAYSNAEKTVLDLCYRALCLGENAAAITAPLREYSARIDRERFAGHLVHYPRRLGELLGGEHANIL